MKMISLLTAAALLAAGSANAATAAAPTTTSAPRAASGAPAPATAQVTAAKQDNHCRDEANEKKLSGAARTAFVKKCRADSMKKK